MVFDFMLITLAKTMNTSLLSTVIVRQIGLINLGIASSLQESILWIQTSCTPLKKMTLCCYLLIVRELGFIIRKGIWWANFKLWMTFFMFYFSLKVWGIGTKSSLFCCVLIVGQNRLFTLGKASKENENSEYRQAALHLD